MSSGEHLIADLRKIAIFADLEEAQLAWLADNATERRLEPGEVVVAEGGPAEHMIVLLEGELQGRRERSRPGGRLRLRAPRLRLRAPATRRTRSSPGPL